KLIQTSGQTKPPAPYNEGTLLAAMEKAGLGTVATRADIIEKLFNNFLMEKKGKEIHITSKGKQLLELVPPGLKSPQLTASWEQRLGLISRGAEAKGAFIGEMRNYARDVVEQIKKSSETFRHDNLTGHKCPDCGKYMLQVNGKKGKMLVCQDRECGHRTSLSRTSNARCPQCHKKLELRGEGENQIFVCSCGYREKLSAFTQRKQQEKTSLSKKEISGYLNKHNQADDKPMNTALADALAKFKVKED
ncbi:MAG TPA: DNA topoisomerase, partial [Bacillota bacterium]|nr:DNA topoisomerase [Bacillota bacterium]